MQPLRLGQAMLLTRCTSVHTCFMKQPIDVLYLDAGGIVTRCVANLPPWRSSISRGKDEFGVDAARASNVLELAAGSIALLGIAVGSRVKHNMFNSQATLSTLPLDKHISHTKKTVNPASQLAFKSTYKAAHKAAHKAANTQAARQKGSAMIEFAVVAPIITLLGLATLQYGLIFFAKNQYNHAAFMAARAGSVANANMESMTKAYIQALIPLYGGGTSASALAASYAKTRDALAGNIEIVMLNPTTESFADFNDPALQKKLGLGEQRVIPNGGLAFKKAAIIQANSGQNAQDANLLKLRITHGYAPQVPLVGSLYRRYLEWLDPGTDAFHSQRIRNGFIPMVSNVTMQMQSDAIEGATVSTPGPGNGGVAANPGNVPGTHNPPPACATVSCGSPVDEAVSGGTGGGQNGSGSASPPPNMPPEPGNPGTGGTGPGGICTRSGLVT